MMTHLRDGDRDLLNIYEPDTYQVSSQSQASQNSMYFLLGVNRKLQVMGRKAVVIR